MIATGQRAPEFQLPVTAHPVTGEAPAPSELALQELRGHWVVLYFYPRDQTPGCTLEALDFSALLPQFREKGALVLGISKDSLKKHVAFCAKSNLAVPLLSDADGDVSERFGVWQEKQMAGRKYMGIVRSTFLIDPEGVVRKVWSPVKTAGHAKAVLTELSAQQ